MHWSGVDLMLTWRLCGAHLTGVRSTSRPYFAALETSDGDAPFMIFARLDALDALELTEIHSEAVCRNSLSRAPHCLGLRARGPILSGLCFWQPIYAFQLFWAF